MHFYEKRNLFKPAVPLDTHMQVMQTMSTRIGGKDQTPSEAKIRPCRHASEALTRICKSCRPCRHASTLAAGLFFASRQRSLMVLTCSWASWPKKDTERIWNYLKSQYWTRNVRNWTKSLVSGIWFLSPEAGGTLRRQLGKPKWAAASHSPLGHCISTL